MKYFGVVLNQKLRVIFDGAQEIELDHILIPHPLAVPNLVRTVYEFVGERLYSLREGVGLFEAAVNFELNFNYFQIDGLLVQVDEVSMEFVLGHL